MHSTPTFYLVHRMETAGAGGRQYVSLASSIRRIRYCRIFPGRFGGAFTIVMSSPSTLEMDDKDWEATAGDAIADAPYGGGDGEDVGDAEGEA